MIEEKDTQKRSSIRRDYITSAPSPVVSLLPHQPAPLSSALAIQSSFMHGAGAHHVLFSLLQKGLGPRSALPHFPSPERQTSASMAAHARVNAPIKRRAAAMPSRRVTASRPAPTAQLVQSAWAMRRASRTPCVRREASASAEAWPRAESPWRQWGGGMVPGGVPTARKRRVGQERRPYQRSEHCVVSLSAFYLYTPP